VDASELMDAKISDAFKKEGDCRSPEFYFSPCSNPQACISLSIMLPDGLQGMTLQGFISSGFVWMLILLTFFHHCCHRNSSARSLRRVRFLNCFTMLLGVHNTEDPRRQQHWTACLPLWCLKKIPTPGLSRPLRHEIQWDQTLALWTNVGGLQFKGCVGLCLCQ
jgi:hypothetical protein